MQIFADPASPWFSWRAHSCTVYLDGVELSHCLRADEEHGEVECCVVDAGGGIVQDGDSVRVVTMRGRVAVVCACMNFDAWMRARTDRAHREFMQATGPK